MLQENFTVRLLEMLRTGELDCAILAEPFPDTGLAIAPLYDEPFLVAVPQQHALAQRKSISSEELKQETMLLLGTGTAFATMCWRSARSSRALPAMPRASARASRAPRWRRSSTWWPRAWG
jgi:DNA-binding transcriptional LysR family regulator